MLRFVIYRMMEGSAFLVRLAFVIADISNTSTDKILASS